MIYICNEEKINKINLTKDNYFVISDFDQTITSGSSVGSWGINLDKSEEFSKERDALYNYYRPIEVDNVIDRAEKFKLMEDWYGKSLNMLIKYNVTEEAIEKTVKTGKFKLRDGAIEFLQKMYNDNVPVLMLSAGIGNVIIKVLEYNNVWLDNMKLDSNFLIFKNKEIEGISNKIIHTMNKNAESLLEKFGDLVKDKKNIILFGDVLSDINMVKKEDLDKTITIGFLDVNEKENFEFYKNTFDIVCTENTSFTDVIKFLNL